MKVVFIALLLVAAVWLQPGECTSPLRGRDGRYLYPRNANYAPTIHPKPIDFCKLNPYACGYPSFKSYCEWQANGEMWCA
ncbi:hypothetical protein QR680_004017 [Steinernema hermaphroditum]|uniref:Uncharacterized protein n=1 Tax=Steinernema hermaphroditum TaxID=289476 RepID=A0AA39HME0_9BILA|nr:hypothetical protein QR680_004017 [Steinernema hermaphroditum]